MNFDKKAAVISNNWQFLIPLDSWIYFHRLKYHIILSQWIRCRVIISGRKTHILVQVWCCTMINVVAFVRLTSVEVALLVGRTWWYFHGIQVWLQSQTSFHFPVQQTYCNTMHIWDTSHRLTLLGFGSAVICIWFSRTILSVLAFRTSSKNMFSMTITGGTSTYGYPCLSTCINCYSSWLCDLNFYSSFNFLSVKFL